VISVVEPLPLLLQFISRSFFTDDKTNSMLVSSPGGVNDEAVLEESTTTTPQQQENNETNKSEKIKVHLVAVGSAPILKKSKFLMNSDDRFVVAITFLRKILKLSPSNSSLFLYVNAAFVPSPEERIGDLFDCFGSRGELVIHYCMQEAWG
jgi:ubiquitin-like protein ATG12